MIIKTTKKIILIIIVAIMLIGVSNTVLAATAKTYHFYFNFNGSGQSTITERYKVGDTVKFPTPNAWHGHTFLGWGENTYDSKGKYQAGYKYKTTEEENKTFYAVWKEEQKYKIEFDSQGGKKVNDITYYMGDVIEFPSTSRDGYKFLGWKKNGAKNVEYTAGQQVVTKKGALENKYYAVWEEIKIKYTFTFDAQGGSAVAPIEYYEKDKVVFPVSTRKEYTFLGWGESKSGTKVNYTAGQEVKINTGKNKTFYAKWQKIETNTSNNNQTNTKPETTKPTVEEKTYKLKYNTQGAATTINDVTFKKGSSVKIATAPTKEGYKFIQWNTNANGTGTAFQPGNAIMNYEKDITIYAIWEKLPEVKPVEPVPTPDEPAKPEVTPDEPDNLDPMPTDPEINTPNEPETDKKDEENKNDSEPKGILGKLLSITKNKLEQGLTLGQRLFNLLTNKQNGSQGLLGKLMSLTNKVIGGINEGISGIMGNTQGATTQTGSTILNTLGKVVSGFKNLFNR